MAHKKSGFLEKISSRYSRPFIPVHPRAPLNYQLSLYGSDDKGFSETALGRFYEQISASLYGATRFRPNMGANGRSFYPDQVDDSRKMVRECKAVGKLRTLDLRDEQISGYLEVQRRMPDYQFEFAIYRHGADNTGNNGVFERDLVDRFVSEGTAYSLVLPLSIIAAMHDAPRQGHMYSNGSPQKRSAHRYEGGKKYTPRTRVNRGFIQHSLVDVLDVIHSLSLNSSDFSVRRFISPRDFKFEERRLARFPILIVRPTAKGHARWIQSLSESDSCETDLPSVTGVDDGIPF